MLRVLLQIGLFLARRFLRAKVHTLGLPRPLAVAVEAIV
jgi:hypothetical protein